MKHKAHRNDELTPDKYLSKSELLHLRKMLKEFPSRDATMIEVALATGARACELLSTTKENIYPDEKAIFFRGSKGGFSRTIPLKPALFARVKALADSSPDGRPFPISYQRLVQIWADWKPANKSWHSLRHTFAVNLYEKTKDIQLVRKALGHRWLSTTAIYTDIKYTTEELRKVL